MSKLLVIKHVEHEGLGTFEKHLKQADVSVDVLNAFEASAVWPDLKAYEGLVVMGGPMSVNDHKKHPFLAKEFKLIEAAIKQDLPYMGICLGAQILAHVLGAPVSPLPMKEIGWHPIMREPDADEDSLCDVFGQTESVFQWHGENFEIPKKAKQLFSAPLCYEQGFSYGNAYGFQFHIEVDAALIKSWMKVPVMKAELDELKGMIDPETILASIPEHIGRLEELSAHVAQHFAKLLTTASK